ncbi:hypothetical protein D9M70_574790 [compost metagenome]
MFISCSSAPKLTHLVGHDHVYRQTAEQAFAVIAPLVEVHLQEPGIISSRRDQAGSSGKEGFASAKGIKRVIVGVVIKDRPGAVLFGLHIGKTRRLAFRQVKIGVIHLQRIKDPFFKKDIQGFSGQHLDQVTGYIKPRAVFVFFSGIKVEGHPGQATNVFAGT